MYTPTQFYLVSLLATLLTPASVNGFTPAGDNFARAACSLGQTPETHIICLSPGSYTTCLPDPSKIHETMLKSEVCVQGEPGVTQDTLINGTPGPLNYFPIALGPLLNPNIQEIQGIAPLAIRQSKAAKLGASFSATPTSANYLTMELESVPPSEIASATAEVVKEHRKSAEASFQAEEASARTARITDPAYAVFTFNSVYKRGEASQVSSLDLGTVSPELVGSATAEVVQKVRESAEAVKKEEEAYWKTARVTDKDDVVFSWVDKREEKSMSTMQR